MNGVTMFSNIFFSPNYVHSHSSVVNCSWAALIYLSLCFAVAFTGCDGKAYPHNQLQYWNGFVGPDGNITEPIIRDFEVDSNLKVEIQKMPWNVYFDKLIAAIAAGDPPDVFVLHVSELAAYAAMGALMPLDEFVDRDDSFVPRADRVPQIWDKCLYQGRRYAVPLDMNLQALYYNKDLFDAAGIPYLSETEPISGEQLLDIAWSLTVDNDHAGQPKVWGFSLSSAPYTYTETFVWQFGGEFLSEDLSEVRLDSPQSLEAIRWMCDLVQLHTVMPPPEGRDTWQAFLQGQIAMIVEGCWILNGLEKNAQFRWGVAPFFVAGYNSALWGSGHLLCLPRNLPPERIPNALALVKYLNDTGVMWSTSGMIPTRWSQINSKDFQTQRRMVPFVSQLERTRFEPPSPIWLELRDRFEQSIVSALTGIKTPEQALEEATNRMCRTLERYR